MIFCAPSADQRIMTSTPEVTFELSYLEYDKLFHKLFLWTIWSFILSRC